MGGDFKERDMNTHTMQAAIALSPVNKACARREDGLFLIQEYAHEKYRMWFVPDSEVLLQAGLLSEKEIDDLSAHWNVDPGAQIWQSMGTGEVADHSAMETAMQVLAGQILNLRTELLAIKAMLAEITGEE